MTSIIHQVVWENDLEALNGLLQQFTTNRTEIDFIHSIDEWDLRGSLDI